MKTMYRYINDDFDREMPDQAATHCLADIVHTVGVTSVVVHYSDGVTVSYRSKPAGSDLCKLARHIRNAYRELSAALNLWTRNDWPSDLYTPDNGYPFAQSLEEQVAALDAWADRIEEDAR